MMSSLQGNRPKRATRQVERHLNIHLLPVLSGLLLILYIVTGYRGWLVFGLGLGGAWLIAWIWTRSLEKNLWLERKIHMAWATVGESVPEQIKLVNHGWLPALWVEISDDSTTLERPLKLVSDVDQHASRNRNISHLFKKRGLYSLGPTIIRTGDPLGIYTLTLHDQHASTILVTPPLVPLSHLRIASGGVSGDERRKQGGLERIISDTGLRNYVPGDSLRRIHWRASAHHDTLIVRQLESASTRDWWIVVDLDREVQAGSGENSTTELCIVLAASLALRGLRERRRVGMLLAGPNLVRIEPGSDLSQRWRILSALAVAEEGSRPLADLLALRRPSQAAMAIVITPSTHPGWVAVAEQGRRGSELLALLVNPQDFGGQGSRHDQGKVTSALALKHIRYSRIPHALLAEAYATSVQRSRRNIDLVENGKQYHQPRREQWQRLG